MASVEAKTIFEAISKTPQELLSDSGLGLYIPSYQRPYSWDKEKVSRLMEDLGHGIKTLLRHDDSFTFLGTVITIHDTNNVTVQPIVREDVPSKVLTVIDGQQRMTTLIILCLALHNQIHLSYKQLLKKIAQIEKIKSDESKNPSLDLGEESKDAIDLQLDAYEWLDGKTQEILILLSRTFYEKQPYGRSPLYPRMIRSLDDQWSKNDKSKRYFSPIAHLIYNYICEIDKQDYEITEYKPEKRNANIEGEEAIIGRYNQISKLLSSFANKKMTVSEMEEVPDIEKMYDSLQLQEALLGYPINKDYLNSLQNDEKIVFDNLARLVLYANYVLKRVVLTVVKGKNEDYAFTIFESLNTTGEPLTAFETFKPRVVHATGLENYEQSEEKILMDKTAKYLSDFSVGNSLQKATKDLLIQFLAAYAGLKVSGRLAEQRSALKECFEDAPKEEKFNFIKTLAYCASFKKYLWENDNYDDVTQFFGNNRLSSSSKLCLKFLADIKHTIVIPILTIFFKQVADESDIELKRQRFNDFESALHAIVAFSVLWRSSRQGTAGIDNEYREILNKGEESTNFKPICINANKGIIDINSFKAELKSRLQNPNRKGQIENKESYIQKSYLRPVYDMKKIAKFLLLASHHNCIENPNHCGLLIKAKEDTNRCLSIEEYTDDKNLSLEHIAPQTNSSNWGSDLYETPDTIHSLGNLTLVSNALNSSLGNRTWTEKRVFYQVIGAKTKEEAHRILVESAENGINFREHSQDILSAYNKCMPNLSALGNYNGVFNKAFVEERSKHLYGLAWDELIEWLSE